MAITLQELCEPVFQEICRLNRLVRKGGGSAADLPRIIATIRSLFEKTRGAASEDVGVLNQYIEVEKPLVYFVDFMISESALPWASEWPSLEQEKFGELVGQLRFFEMLDETLADPSPAAADRLEIFYKCIGLGFTGFYANEQEVLRRKMLEIQNRLRDRVDLDRAPQLIRQEERHVDTSNLYEAPGRGLGMMAIALVALIAVLFISSYVLYQVRKNDLSEDLDTIVEFGETRE